MRNSASGGLRAGHTGGCGGAGLRSESNVQGSVFEYCERGVRACGCVVAQAKHHIVQWSHFASRAVYLIFWESGPVRCHSNRLAPASAKSLHRVDQALRLRTSSPAQPSSLLRGHLTAPLGIGQHGGPDRKVKRSAPKCAHGKFTRENDKSKQRQQ